ncbi:MAG: hypothetical protein VX438_13405 [Planctomycetota bacterium]|nr:hypothetical protein [Planctomycetota bacterium]
MKRFQHWPPPLLANSIPACRFLPVWLLNDHRGTTPKTPSDDLVLKNAFVFAKNFKNSGSLQESKAKTNQASLTEFSE